MAINFFSETDTFNFKNKRITSKWLKEVIVSYKKLPGEISIIFCTDEQLLEINQKYLKHFYYTDVITFNYNAENSINGDIYISIDRIFENAANFGETFDKELFRVIVHGILHLIGFNDKKPAERDKMRDLENFHLKDIFK